MSIPSIYIAIMTALAGFAWLVYAGSQKGRLQAGVLGWMSLPFFVLSALYLLKMISPDTAIISIALTQTIILFALVFRHKTGRKNGK